MKKKCFSREKKNFGENDDNKTVTGTGEKIMENQNVNQAVNNDDIPHVGYLVVGIILLKEIYRQDV
jgi:hypothetical protein